MIRNLLSCVISLCLCITFSYSLNAEGNRDGFETVFEEAVNSQSFHASDSDGNDITELILKLYYEEGTESVNCYFKENYGTFGYLSYETHSSLRALEDYTTVTDTEVVTAEGTYFGTKQWRTRLTGTFYYNTKTGLITRAVNPSLSLDWHLFGEDFSPYLSNVSTSAKISDQSYVTFKANYAMYANFSDENYPGGLVISYGSHTHQFTAS